MKSIGDGTKTKVWLEKWVMDSHPRRPMNKQSLIDLNLDVSSLLTQAKTWRGDVVKDLFPPEDAARIMIMPVGGVTDKIIWAYTDNGSYTVKSGYWFAANHPLVPSITPSTQILRRNELKQRVWNIKTLPKIRMFIWRVLSGALAVANRLNSEVS